MLKYTRRLGAPIALVTVTLLGACGSDAKKADSTALGADTTLNRDLALANRDSAAQPQLKDVPASTPAASTPKPSASKPSKPAPKPSTPTPKPSAPATGAGTPGASRRCWPRRRNWRRRARRGKSEGTGPRPIAD